MMANLITQAEYARRRGVSRVAVHKAVTSGRISLIDGKIDPEVADIQWARNTDHDQAARSRGVSGFQMRLNGSEQNAPVGAQGAGPEHEPDADGDTQDGSLLANKIRIAAADAELKEDSLRKSRSELVLASQIQREAFAKARMARDILSSFPARVAPLLVGKPLKDIEAVMREEVRKVIASITATESAAKQ